MPKTKIALACQGGGSQTAFTAGAVKTLCQARLGEEFEFVSISGTSGLDTPRGSRDDARREDDPWRARWWLDAIRPATLG